MIFGWVGGGRVWEFRVGSKLAFRWLSDKPVPEKAQIKTQVFG